MNQEKAQKKIKIIVVIDINLSIEFINVLNF